MARDFATDNFSRPPVSSRICWDNAIIRIFLNSTFNRITGIFRTAGCATAR